MALLILKAFLRHIVYFSNFFNACSVLFIKEYVKLISGDRRLQICFVIRNIV